VVSKLSGDAKGPLCFLNLAVAQSVVNVHGHRNLVFCLQHRSGDLDQAKLPELEFQDRVDALSRYLDRF
jgi:hypothetical protein